MLPMWSLIGAMERDTAGYYYSDRLVFLFNEYANMQMSMQMRHCNEPRWRRHQTVASQILAADTQLTHSTPSRNHLDKSRQVRIID